MQKKNNFIKIKTAEPYDTREDPESQGWRAFLYRMQPLVGMGETQVPKEGVTFTEIYLTEAGRLVQK